VGAVSDSEGASVNEGLKTIELSATLSEDEYSKLAWRTDWPVFRIASIWNTGMPPSHHVQFVSCGADKEQTPAVYVNGKLVNFGSILYVTGGPNDGAEVQVVGFNREVEPIVQRVDDRPLEWPEGHPRHVCDMPTHRLSWDKPAVTLLEAARAVAGESQQGAVLDGGWCRLVHGDPDGRSLATTSHAHPNARYLYLYDATERCEAFSIVHHAFAHALDAALGFPSRFVFKGEPLDWYAETSCVERFAQAFAAYLTPDRADTPWYAVHTQEELRKQEPDLYAFIGSLMSGAYLGS
jgi:hypothetical protein